MVGNNNEILQYLHCNQCFKEKPDDISMKDYARYEVGWTPDGLQMWCIRHDCNVMHVDFQNQRHPANLSRIKTPEERRSKIRLVKPGEEDELTTKNKE